MKKFEIRSKLHMNCIRSTLCCRYDPTKKTAVAGIGRMTKKVGIDRNGRNRQDRQGMGRNGKNSREW